MATEAEQLAQTLREAGVQRMDRVVGEASPPDRTLLHGRTMAVRLRAGDLVRRVVPFHLEHPIHESLLLAGLLAAGGGVLDAFTYLGYDHVFANAMTGNVVLTGIALLTGQWGQLWWHLVPILAFLVGVFAAEALRVPRVHDVVRRPPVACLGLEALFLAVAAGGAHLPAPLVTSGISFVAALQTTTFRELRGAAYSSVMVTGNLRSFGMASFGGLLRREVARVRTAGRLGVVCFAFLLGTALGGWSTPRLGDSALWLAVGLLTLGLLIMLSHPLCGDASS
jgi:uncharacterized membrane protein YoaK (UPF0700 family)